MEERKRILVRVRHEERLHSGDPLERLKRDLRLLFSWKLLFRKKERAPKFSSPTKRAIRIGIVEQPHRYRGFWGELFFPITEMIIRVIAELFPNSRIARQRRKKVRRITNPAEFFISLIYLLLVVIIFAGMVYLIIDQFFS